jgi:hypothetical protein
MDRTPPEVNPAVPPPFAVGAPGDWSSLMTDLQVSLTRAENELRLIHMDRGHKHKAVGYLITSRHILLQRERWCHES